MSPVTTEASLDIDLGSAADDPVAARQGASISIRRAPDPAWFEPIGFPPPWPDRPWIFGVMVASANGVVAWHRSGPEDDPVLSVLGGDDKRPVRIADQRHMRHLRCYGDVAIGAGRIAALRCPENLRLRAGRSRAGRARRGPRGRRVALPPLAIQSRLTRGGSPPAGRSARAAPRSGREKRRAATAWICHDAGARATATSHRQVVHVRSRLTA